MPFKIVKFKNGFRLCKLKEPNKCFSNKPMTKKQVEKQMKAIAINENKIEGGNKNISKIKMFELFKGTGSIGKVAKKMGFDVVSLDFDPIYTPDIETDILKWDYKKWAKDNDFYPNYIWASPPCNTFSPLAYPLKERDIKTAKPKSKRAEEGTKILHKTLEIINYFKSKNSNLLYTIENPKGMMRYDEKILKLPNRETTLYCLYGDFKKKPTDFWSNFKMDLDTETKKCKNKTISVVDLKTIEERYSIPSKLIKKILNNALLILKNENKIEGGAKKYIEIPIDAIKNKAISTERYAKINENVANYFKPFEFIKYAKENPKTILLPSEKKARKQKIFELKLMGINPNDVADEAKGEKAEVSKSYEELPSLLGNFEKAPDVLVRGSGKFKPLNEELYNKIKNEVYKRNPKHSLYRSALIQKIYQSEGGKYLNNKLPKMNIKKWFKQDWISLNDYLRGEKISCGNSNTQEKYNEYPLCRPFEIAKKLSKNEIKEMIKEKNILKNKPLKTEKVINRKDINIKPTMSGLGSNKFINQLNKLNIKPDEYLKIAKSTAKQAGYNPDLLKFSLSKKLNYNGVDFGAPNYNDFIIYKLTNPEIANNKRDNYRKRAKKVMEETKNKYSPASLSYYILW